MEGQRRDPPVLVLACAAMALILAGGIYQASHLPRHVPLTLPTITVIAAAVLLVAALALVTRIEDFAWKRFVTVGRWGLLGYAAIPALVEYALVDTGVRGNALLLVTLSVVLFWLTVPLLVAFTTARHVPSD